VKIRLRNYRPEDFETLWTLDQACFEEGISYEKVELQHYLQMKTAFTLVAEAEDGTVLGFIIAHRRKGGYGHVLTIDVDPAIRQHGVGTALLQGAHQRLEGLGCHTMFLETAVNNLAAIAFYKRHGYSILRTLPRYYRATGMDAFLLTAKLARV
jgi:ribosomal-protein-alanine N-acetyltransferase